MDSAGPGRAGNPVCLGGGPGLWAQRLRGSLHPAAVSHPGGYPAGGGGLSDRLTRGVELYQAGWADKLLMSGDNRSQDYNELATMHRVALEKGVPQADVVLDYAGLSTYDSLYRARDIFGVKKVVIVTQEYHMYRALYLARALGLEAWGVAADGQNYRGQTMRDLREILARDKDVLWAIFQPEPTYLGDPDPLTGTQ